MVLVILGELEFDAEKFETRTMPTPDMKSKEMIYWIRLNTHDKRLALELERYLKGSSQIVDLKVPGAFIVARTELEDYQPKTLPSHQGGEAEQNSYVFEILLRRRLPETKNEQTQTPYG